MRKSYSNYKNVSPQPLTLVPPELFVSIYFTRLLYNNQQ